MLRIRNAIFPALLLFLPPFSVVALARQPGNIWTKDDIKMMCESRWQDQSTAIKACVERNQRKIDKEKTPGELQELEALKESDVPQDKTAKH